MIEYVDVNKITPAPYNPRRISAEQFSELQESIRKIGFVVPILINRRTNIIIAGHQRSKSAKAVGIKEVPAIFVDSLVEGDEIKFNQMHNGTENKDDARIILTKEHPKEQFITIPHEDFDIDKAMNEIRKYRELLTTQQERTLKGQVLSGDIEGAMRGLDKLIRRALLFGDSDGANTE